VNLTPEFCEGEHTYADAAGNVYPSTTELIGRYWPIDRSRYGDGSAAQRGTEIHSLTQVIDTGLFHPGQFENGHEYSGYIRAWEKAKTDIGFGVWEWIEQRFISDELGYAGTVDRLSRRGDVYVVIDIKSGRAEPWHELQLGAYATAAMLAGYPVSAIYDVYIAKNGKYKAARGNESRAISAWKSLMAWHTYRRSVQR